MTSRKNSAANNPLDRIIVNEALKTVTLVYFPNATDSPEWHGVDFAYTFVADPSTIAAFLKLKQQFQSPT